MHTEDSKIFPFQISEQNLWGFPWFDSRFYFNVNGLKPAWIPKSLLTTPLIQDLLKHRSVSNYLRSKKIPLIRKNFIRLKHQYFHLRLTHDFPLWFSLYAHLYLTEDDYTTAITLNKAQQTLFRKIEYLSFKKEPIRLFVTALPKSGISSGIRLFSLWKQLVSLPGIYSLNISSDSKKAKNLYTLTKFFLNKYFTGNGVLNKNPRCASVPFSVLSLYKSILRVNPTKSLFRFSSNSNPYDLHGFDYNLVHLEDIDAWKCNYTLAKQNLISATSGIFYRPETMIIIESSKKLNTEFFNDEFIFAQKGYCLSQLLVIDE